MPFILFRTGPASSGYSLTKVRLPLKLYTTQCAAGQPPCSITVGVWTMENGLPKSRIGLVVDTSFVLGPTFQEYTFNPVRSVVGGPIPLAPSTDYAVSVEMAVDSYFLFAVSPEPPAFDGLPGWEPSLIFQFCNGQYSFVNDRHFIYTLLGTD